MSFASLLSSALTVEGDLPEPLAGSSSALRCFLSSSVGPGHVCAALPGLDLKAGKRDGSSSSVAPAGVGLEESAALHLAVPMLCTRDDVVDVPKRVLANVASSFVQLIDARMRSSLSALLRKTLQRGAMAGFGGGPAGGAGGGVGSDAHTKMVIGLLSSETPVAPTTVVTSFRVLGGGGGGGRSSKVILPIVYEAVIDLSVLGSAVTVAIRAPGTVSATFEDGSGGDGLIRSVEVTLDTLALLRAMMKQARFAVKKAVSVASAIATTLVSAAGPGSAGKNGGGSLNLLGQNLGAGTHRRHERRSSPSSSGTGVRIAPLPPLRRPPSSKKKEEPCACVEPPISSATSEHSSSSSSLSSASSPDSSSCSLCQSASLKNGTGSSADAKKHMSKSKEQNFDMPPPPPRKPLRGCYSSPGLRSGLASALSSNPRFSSSSKRSSYRPVMPLGLLRPTEAAAAERSHSQELRNVRFEGRDGDGNKNAVWGAASGGESSPSSSASKVRCIDSAAAAQGLAMLATTSARLGIKKRARHSEAGASLAAAAAAAATAALDNDAVSGDAGAGGTRSTGPLRKRRVMSCPSII